MEKVQFPRFMVAAEKSGQGKTLITCALLELLKEQHRVSAFKCGPDYIDPMFHRRVAGVPSYNLDSFFSSREELIQLLGLHGGPDRLGGDRRRHGLLRRPGRQYGPGQLL